MLCIISRLLYTSRQRKQVQIHLLPIFFVNAEANVFFFSCHVQHSFIHWSVCIKGIDWYLQYFYSFIAGGLFCCKKIFELKIWNALTFYKFKFLQYTQPLIFEARPKKVALHWWLIVLPIWAFRIGAIGAINQIWASQDSISSLVGETRYRVLVSKTSSSRDL